MLTNPAWLSYLHFLQSCISNKLIFKGFNSTLTLTQTTAEKKEMKMHYELLSTEAQQSHYFLVH